MARELLELARELLLKGPRPPGIVVGRRLVLYEVDISSVDLAVRETLPAAERAVLGLAGVSEAASVGDADAFLGLGPELAAQIMRRLQRQGLLAPVDASPRPSSARPVNPTSPSIPPRWGLSTGGMSVLTAGAREIVRHRRLRLLLAADPPLVVRVLSPPRYAKMTRESPLAIEDVPEALRNLDAHLAISAPERGAVFGVAANLAAIPGGDHVAGRLLGFTQGASYEVRRTADPREAWLVAAWSPASEGWATYLAVSVREGADIRPVAHVAPGAVLPTDVQSSEGILRALVAQGLNVSLPWVDGTLPAYAEAGVLEELLGDHDRPAPKWKEATLGALAGHVRVRGRPVSTAASHAALLCFLSRRPREIGTDLSRAVVTTWRDLVTFWQTEGHAPPPEEWIQDRLWEDRALRAALCQGRLRRDLVDDYRERGRDHG
jgi:hypothetical protein